MNNQDSLFALIKSLSAKEAELFRQHSFPPNKRTKKAVQWQMFKLVHAMNSYQPEVLQRLFKVKDEFKRQRLIGVNRFELKRKLLLFLGTLADEPILQRHNQIQALNTLYKKGLYNECYKQANLFKAEQTAAGQFSYASIANFYALMSAELSGETNSTDLILQLAQEQVKLSEDAYTNAYIYRIYTRLYVIQLGGVLVTDKKSRLEIQQLITDPALAADHDKLSFNTRRYFFMAKAIAARLTGNVKDAVYYTEQEFFNAVNTQGKILPTDEIQSIADVIHSHILANNTAKIKEWLKLFYSKLNEYRLNKENYMFLILHFESALSALVYRTATAASALTVAKNNLYQKLTETEQYYLKNSTKINTGIRKILETDLAMGYYEYGDLKKSLRYFNAFLDQDINADMGNRIKDIYYLFSMLVKYDLVCNNDTKYTIVSFAKECTKVRKKLLAKATDFDISIEMAFLDTFNTIAKHFHDKKKVSDTFKKLLTVLKNYETDSLSYLNQLNNTFNLTAWVKNNAERYKH
ncbi:MAG: hypothetical protein RLZZ367_2506 [Bacteroidota bacterium]|jgi:hypothetical protein